LKSLDVQLSATDLRCMEEAFPKGIAAGDRYTEVGMRLVNG